MKSTVKIDDIMKIVTVNHGNPHDILGLHEVEINGKKCLSVRAFHPKAKYMELIDEADKTKRYPMEKIHDDGFFEGVIEERDAWFFYSLYFQGYEDVEWNGYDPYCFPPQITELDRYLFGEGNHYNVFDCLGANIKEVDGIKGVSFGLWAPNAKTVSVIGDFNMWDGRIHPMRALGMSGIWELFVPGISNYDCYKFEIHTKDSRYFNKADPYAKFAQLRPETASVVYDINGYQWNDQAWADAKKARHPNQGPMSIYEVHLGSWRRKEEDRFLTYREMAEDLIDYVLEMGYTHIELMPVEEHPFDGSWGYQVTGYYAATSRFGTPEDFMYFVDQCHQNNIGVILDWVPAHFPKDEHGLAKFDGTALYEHQDPRQGEHPDWGTLIFNFGRNEVKNFLIGNAIFWIEKYHIDGLRVDAVASMLYLDYGKQDGQWVPNQYGGRENLEAVEFLKHMNSVLLGRYPEALMIAEESTAWPGVSRPVEQGGLGFNLKWNMGWMNDFLRYVEKDPIYRKYHHNDLTFSMVYAYTENFVLVLSHDEVVHGKKSVVGKMPGDLWQKFANVRVAYGFMFAHPGKKLLFMGSEFGQFDEWSESKSLDWHLLEYDHHHQLQTYCRELNAFYKAHPALWAYDFNYEGFEWIDSHNSEKSILSFTRKANLKEETILAVCNFTPETHFEYRIGAPFSGQWEEIFNSDHEKFGGSHVVNETVLETENVACNGREQSLVLKIPPLGIVILGVVNDNK